MDDTQRIYTCMADATGIGWELIIINGIYWGPFFNGNPIETISPSDDVTR